MKGWLVGGIGSIRIVGREAGMRVWGAYVGYYLSSVKGAS